MINLSFSPLQQKRYEKCLNTYCKVVREEFPRVEGAFHLHNVLSKEECDFLIKVTEAQGYDNSTHPNYQVSFSAIFHNLEHLHRQHGITKQK